MNQSFRPMHIRPFADPDTDDVVALWEQCELTRPWNDPRKDIARKLQVDPELFLVGEIDGSIVATAMAGYEGHRGWVNYLAVAPSRRRQGIGRKLVTHVEELLVARGCPKINLQIRTANQAAIAFYASIGFTADPVISMSKRLEHDDR